MERTNNFPSTVYNLVAFPSLLFPISTLSYESKWHRTDGKVDGLKKKKSKGVGMWSKNKSRAAHLRPREIRLGTLGRPPETEATGTTRRIQPGQPKCPTRTLTTSLTHHVGLKRQTE